MIGAVKKCVVVETCKELNSTQIPQHSYVPDKNTKNSEKATV